MAAPNNQFRATNATDVTDTTYQAIKAAPSDTTYQFYEIDHVVITQKTASEAPTIVIADTAASPETLLTWRFLDAGSVQLSFNPPIRVATGKGISAKALSSVGDTVVTIVGRLCLLTQT